VIAGVSGILEAVGDSWVIVAVGGVSLRVATPSHTVQALGGIGSRVRFHTHLVVREEELALFGFTTPEALQLFQKLVTVNGVGPRTALALLNTGSAESVAASIAGGDVRRLQRAQGVGRKTAERIILELRDRLIGAVAKDGSREVGSSDGEAVAALVSLGYSAAEAEDVLRRTPEDSDRPLEERVRLALQRLAAR